MAQSFCSFFPAGAPEIKGAVVVPPGGHVSESVVLGTGRFTLGADGVARQTWVFDKTGTTARLCGNMGILVAQGRNGGRYPYTFIGIIEKARPTKHYRAWKDNRGDVIRDVSGIAYQHLSRLHNLV